MAPDLAQLQQFDVCGLNLQFDVCGLNLRFDMCGLILVISPVGRHTRGQHLVFTA